MAYIIEQWDAVRLHFFDAPHTPEVNPLAINLDFAGAEFIPALPWNTPSITVEYCALMQTAGRAAYISALPITPASAADHEHRSVFDRATVRDFSVRAVAQESDAVDALKSIVAGDAIASQYDFSARWLESGKQDKAAGMQWNTAVTKERAGYVSSWVMTTKFRDTPKSMNFYSVNLTGNVYDDSAAFLALLNTDAALNIDLDFTTSLYKPQKPEKIHFEFGLFRAKRPIVPHDISASLTARQAAQRDNRRQLPWGLGDTVWRNINLPYPVDPNPVDPVDPVEPPVRRVTYIIMNTLQIFDTATNTPLNIRDVSISHDIDSISWKFTGTVFGDATLDLVRPDEDGMKDISVTINTHNWVFSIERYSGDEKFASQKFSISGVSRTQYMSAPFAPIRSYTNAIATTAAQAATAELLDTGFTLDWPTGDDDDLADWNIPIGALSYRDKSPAQVIGQIVSAAGGVMIPSMNSDRWTIKPRYKFAPWQWDDDAIDAIIYIGMVASRAAKYEPAPAFDACYVSGINHGVAVDVHRLGSGGLNPMPDIYDDLITDSQPAISRGKSELAASGNKVIETLSIVIPESGAAPGILIPGYIVKVTHPDDARDYYAMVLSTSIRVAQAGSAEVYQSVTLERSA